MDSTLKGGQLLVSLPALGLSTRTRRSLHLNQFLRNYGTVERSNNYCPGNASDILSFIRRLNLGKAWRKILKFPVALC